MSRKIFSGFDKIILKCDYIDKKTVPGIRQPNFYGVQ